MDEFFQWHKGTQKWVKVSKMPEEKTGFFETIKYYNKKLYFKELHYQRYILTLNKFQIFPKIDFLQLLLDIENFLVDNHIFHARVKLVFFHTSDDEFTIYLQSNNLPFHHYHPSPECINLGIYHAEYLDENSCIKSLERGIYNRAKQYATQNDFHDVVLVNTVHQVIETTISNIFYIKNKVIYTPILTHEGVEGVMKAYIMQQCERLSIQIVERAIFQQDLVDADEIFLTNVIRGVRPVEKFMGIKKSMTFTQAISKLLFAHNTTSTYV